MEYRKTFGKRTECNAKLNSPAADRTGGAFIRGGAFTKAGGAKLNELSAG